MKSFIPCAIALLLIAARADSEVPVENPVLILQSISAENKILLERQKASLEKLDAIIESARQARILSKRS